MARILLIEDSPTDTRVFTTLLEKNGHQVIAAGSAEDGIAAAKRDQPDLVLMDVILPGMYGFQATSALTSDAEKSAVPIILISTQGMEIRGKRGVRKRRRRQ